MLQNVYQNHTWQPWRFTHAPSGYWDKVAETGDRKSIADLLVALGHQFGIDSSNLDKWYSITSTQIRKENPAADAAISKVGGLRSALEIAFPNHPWNSALFGGGSPAKQTGLHVAAQQTQLNKMSHLLFPQAQQSSVSGSV